MLYFEGLTQEAEIKTRYKELAKVNHPDLGGCVEVMKAINTQYEKVIEGAYQRAGKSITEIEELLAKDAAVMEKLNQIIQCVGVEVEICGRWIWVSGDTKPIKEILKSASFKWAKNKCSWFWRAEEDKSYNRKKMSMDEIRASHGSQKLNKTYYKQSIA